SLLRSHCSRLSPSTTCLKSDGGKLATPATTHAAWSHLRNEKSRVARTAEFSSKARTAQWNLRHGIHWNASASDSPTLPPEDLSSSNVAADDMPGRLRCRCSARRG